MDLRTDRIQLDYRLTFDSPFIFGTGIRVGIVDRTVVRDREKYLYVPGSTIKGVLREHCEQLARFYLKDKSHQQLIKSPHEAEAALSELGERITMVTRIFGSQMHPGLLCFEDARQRDKTQYSVPEEDGEGKYKDVQTSIYIQVRLDRPTRTAVKGALYTSEFGVRGLTFDGQIVGWLRCSPIGTLATTSGEDEERFTKAPTYSLLLLLAGLKMIERLGGNKSTGKGQCKCTITGLKIGNKECSQDQSLSWLKRLDVLASYPLS